MNEIFVVTDDNDMLDESDVPTQFMNQPESPILLSYPTLQTVKVSVNPVL